MSFFEKEETEKNLQYDDIAFLHFLLTVCLCSTAIFGYLLYKRFSKANIENVKNYSKLKRSGLFTLQLLNQQKRLKKKYVNFNFYCYLTILVFSFLASCSLIYYVGTHETQMIGFDPHEILKVPSDASSSQIKKAYRQLALKYHPDRNQNDPEAQAKFIMISKSYECLTDEEKRQNCLKYGNPDGESSYQVGIGLPKFIISPQNQTYVLPIVFLILLVVVPILFIKWTNRAQTKGDCGLDIRDYSLLYPFFRPEFNASFGFYCLTVLKELEFPQRKLSSQEKQKFLQFLAEKKLLDMKYVMQRMSENQLYVLHMLFKHIARKQIDVQLCLLLPQVMNNLMKFATFFAKRANDKKPLLEDRMPIHWLGVKHIFMLMEFIRTFYNCSLFNPPNFTPFDHLALTKQDYEVSMKHPCGNIKQLVFDANQRKQHLSHFPEQHRKFLDMQLRDLPLLKLDMKIKVGEEVVHEFTIEDFAQIYFKVSKLNSTSGYCYLKKFPFLKEQKYYFMLIYNDNLVHFEEITFQQDSKEYVGKIPYRQGFARDMIFHAFVFSDCRYGLDTKQQVKFNVVQAKEENDQVQIHHEDLMIERRPKTYWEKMLSLQQQNLSDNQLSDTQDSQKDNIKRDNPQRSRKKESSRKKSRLVQEQKSLQESEQKIQQMKQEKDESSERQQEGNQKSSKLKQFVSQDNQIQEAEEKKQVISDSQPKQE